MNLLKLGIGGKIWSLVGLIVVGLTLLTAQSLMAMKESLVEDRRQTLKQLVEAADSVVAYHQGRAAKGEITEENAKAAAFDALRAMRYGKNDYFVVTDLQVVTIMHPLRPDLNGKNMSQVKDPNGIYFARDQVELARRDGGGYVSYSFPRTKDQPPAPKLSYAQMFKPWGWTILTGVYMDDIDEQFRVKVIEGGIKAMGVVFLAVVMGSLIARSITKPLARLVGRMGALAAGDTEHAVDGIERRDEMGALARAMEIFRANSIENKHLLDQQEGMKRTAADERNRALRDMASGLESRVRSAVDAMSRVGERLNGASVAMTRTAEQTSEQTNAVVAATEQTSSNVQTVASAAEELSASGGEISRQVSLTADIARAAAEEADHTNVLVASLAAAAGRIGEVVRLIDDIASQTNLLALNATIEAARA
ncbi:MAG: methyl-accepting chemotaxis protein, partial [Magnetospirillum sp.]